MSYVITEKGFYGEFGNFVIAGSLESTVFTSVIFGG